MAPGDAALTLRHVTHTGDSNHQGTIFGGKILSLIDEAAYLEARKHGLHRWVTVLFDRVEFKAPVFTGDVLTLYTRTVATGRSSVTVAVSVEAERYRGGEKIMVTHATVKMVSVDRDGRSVDFRSKPNIGDDRAAGCAPA
ncbi:MAG: acyl-CoA thioesterase [Planctomycetes bacterium]|nr:acyl-CoA thioesterase [Planctomycetota bacterium]